MKKYLIRFTDEQSDALAKSATARGISAAELIRRVLIEAQLIPPGNIQHGGWNRGMKGKPTQK